MNFHPLAAGLALALTGLALPASVQAERAPNAARQLDTVVVTASRALQPIALDLGSNTVIDRDTIARSQAPDLIDLLARQAGIDISRTGGPGAVSTLFLRGGNSNHVLVLVDGVRVNSAQQGLFDFSQLPLDRIERIEIVRGPRAALWGSDAIGGVIQVFTRAAGDRAAQLRVGSFDRQEAAAQWGVRGEHGSFGIGGGMVDVGGYNATTPSNFSFDPDRDGFTNRHLSLAGHASIGSQALAATLLATDGDVDFDRGTTKARARSGSASLGGTVGAAWSHRLVLGHARESLRTVSAFGSEFTSRRTSLDWIHDLALSPEQALLFGLNHTDEDAVARNATGGLVYDRGRHNTGLFSAWRGTFDTQQFELAARIDDNSQFGRTSNAQAAWGLALTEQWSLNTSWGQGFRAPSTNELYSPGFGGFFAGNPRLQPERSHSLEAGLEWRGTASRLSVSAYRSRVAGLIAFTGPTFGANNIHRAELDGVELQGTTTLGIVTVNGNVGWQRAENALTGAALLRRAPRKAHVSLELPVNEALRLGLDASAVASRQDFDGPLPGYTRFDLRAEATLGAGWRIRARIENLGDRHYTLASGFATPGRSALLEVAYHNQNP